MTNCKEVNPAGERPKYPPPPRSGSAFAAAVFAAIPGLVLVVAEQRVLFDDARPLPLRATLPKSGSSARLSS